MILSAKQLGVLLVVMDGHNSGELADLDQIIEKQTYDTNKPSIQFIVRNLITKGLIEKTGTEVRNQRRKVLFDVTPLGERYSEWSKPKTLKDVITE